jgi:hypothetical protein
MNSPFKFLRRVRIHGRECGAVARALHHEVEVQSLPAVKENVSFTTNERKSMSTKTAFKRTALAIVAAMGFGLLTTVTPANAIESTTLAAAVGPSGQTSLTVVGGTDSTTAALVRLDVTVDSATTGGNRGLQCGETITATVSAVPTSVTAKTLQVNGGSMADTSTTFSTAGGRSDLAILEVKGQTSGTVGATAAASTTSYTNWTKVARLNALETVETNLESYTVVASQATNVGLTADAQLGGCGNGANTEFVNMDGTKQTSFTNNTVSYYVSIFPRRGATVMDQGAYTVQFQLVDINGIVRGTKTVKIDWVSAPSKSDATVALATSGTFLASAALDTVDTAPATYATLTLGNRDGGLVRNADGGVPGVTAKIQESTTSISAWTDTQTLTADDTGTAGADFGTVGAGYSGTLKRQNGVYGLVSAALPNTATSATAGALRSYRIWAGYGNATIQTASLTIFNASGSGTAKAGNTDVLVTAAGMSAADQLLISGTAAANKTSNTWTIPTSTTSATVKFWIQTSADTATPAADITVTPTWSGSHGSANVTPATSTTGTVYTTDASGNFTVTVTNSAPVAGASVALELSGGVAFGGGTYTATLTWAAPTAATIAVADPLSGVYVKTGSTNVTTVIVKDQFGNPVANQSVSVSLGLTSANYSATTTIAPITTGANGTATYSLVGGATTATLDTLTFACVPTACTTTATATMTYNYVSTVPAVGSLNGYFAQDWNSSAVSGTLWPASGNLYQTGTSTQLTLAKDINTSKSMSSYADSTTDALVSFALNGLTSAGASATGAVITVTAASGGHILDAAGLPSASRNFLVGSTGWTSNIQILATKTGDITFTATSGTVSKTFTLKVANASTDARFINIEAAATGTANGAGVPVTVSVTDRFGNPVGAVALVVRASGVGSLLGGATSTSFNTDDAGTYTFLATSLETAGGVGTFTASSSTSADFGSVAGYTNATEIDSTVAAGNSSKSLNITFAAGVSSATTAANAATTAAEAATDAAAEAIDAANAATDAANLAAEAADAATVAAEEARDAADAATAAVEELATQVATLMAALKAQITTLANTVAKIAKKVKA